ncbi:alpha/beta fold hydrolase [Mariniluteicoccus flavus]
MQRRTLDLDGRCLSFLWGEPAGEPRGDVLLLHGGGLDNALLSWGDLAPRLVEAGWRVAAPDHPGFGESDPLPGPADRAAWVAYAGDLADRLSLHRPVVVGLSMGGAMAAGLALARPGNLRGLVLLGCYGLGPTARPVRVMNAALIRSGLLDRLTRLTYARPRLFDLSLRGLVRDPAALAAGVRDELTRQRARGDRAAWQEFQRAELDAPTDLSPRLGEITTPTLLIHGTADPGVPVQLARRAAARLPDARLFEVPGARHWVQRDAPDDVAAAVVAFLGEV